MEGLPFHPSVDTTPTKFRTRCTPGIDSTPRTLWTHTTLRTDTALQTQTQTTTGTDLTPRTFRLHITSGTNSAPRTFWTHTTPRMDIRPRIQTTHRRTYLAPARNLLYQKLRLLTHRQQIETHCFYLKIAF